MVLSRVNSWQFLLHMRFYDFPHIFDNIFVQWLCWPRKTQNVIFYFPQMSKYWEMYRGYHSATRSAFQQNVCTHLATNLHRVHSHSYSSQYFCQLVQKYPLFRTWWYISTVAASQDIRDSRLRVAFSKRSFDFSILSYYHLSFVYKINWFPVICLPAQLLSTPKHVARLIHPACYSLFPNIPSV